jgi:hypothetical protein
VSRLLPLAALAAALLAAPVPCPAANAGGAAGAAGPALPAARDDGIARLRFAWPDAARAKVTYRRTRTGAGEDTTFTARYETRVEAGPRGVRVLTRNTSWAGDLPFAHALAREAIRASEVVVQRVGADGEFAGLEGVEAMRPVLARLFDAAKVPPDAAERALPLAEAAMRAEAEELWNLAVGFWTGADLRVGARYAMASEGELPLLAGVRASQALEFGVRRRVPCSAAERAPRCVEATLRATPDRDAVERVRDALLARLLPDGAERPEDGADELLAESELVLVTDPETLLPRRLVWTKALRLGSAEGGPPAAERIDRSAYDYRWLPPEPPRPPPRRRRAPAPPARPPAAPIDAAPRADAR